MSLFLLQDYHSFPEVCKSLARVMTNQVEVGRKFLRRFTDHMPLLGDLLLECSVDVVRSPLRHPFLTWRCVAIRCRCGHLQLREGLQGLVSAALSAVTPTEVESLLDPTKVRALWFFPAHCHRVVLCHRLTVC